MISSVFAVTAFILARRKGKSPWVFAIIAIIPVFGIIALFYLIAITDRAVYEHLSRIEEKLDAKA